MKSYRFLPASLFAMAAFAGCTTMPEENSSLNEARTDYGAALNSPQVTTYAPSELNQAGVALTRANEASMKREDPATVTHLAYLAKQRVAIAQETASKKAAEAVVANASAERSNIRLEARTAEMNAAQQSAATSQRAATASQQNAEASQRKADASQMSAETSQRQAEASEQQAAMSQQSSEASQRLAETSQLQAAKSQQQSDVSQQQARDSETRNTMLETQLKDLNAKKTERGFVITLGDVLFDSNKAELKPAGRGSVQKLASFLKSNPERQVQIEGHTDSIGSAEHNQELSSRRANAVRESLVGMGITTDRITTQGIGKESPVASNSTAAGRQMNRRVEVILSDEAASEVSSR